MESSVAFPVAKRSSGRRFGSAALISSLILAGGWGGAEGAARPLSAQTSSGGIAFVGASLIPMDAERVLHGHTLLVAEGRIAAIGPDVEVQVPPDATVVPAQGRFLIPGLAEMHAHIPGSQADPASVERTLFLYLAGGVTTIRGMLGDPLHLRLREQAARGEILAPRIYAAGPALSGASAPTPAEGRLRVQEHRAVGYDLLKIQTGLSRATFDTIAATADRIGIPFAGHVPADVGLDRALSARYASIDHLDAYLERMVDAEERAPPGRTGIFGFHLVDRVDPSRIPTLAAATYAAAVWNVPTQSLLEHLMDPDLDLEEMAGWPEMRYVAPATLSQWIHTRRSFIADPYYTPDRARRYLEIRRALILALHDAGAGLILGSDAPQIWNVPGFSARRELEYMVRAGLTPYQALLLATRNAAVHFGDGLEWGTLEVGKSADLVMLDADPLADIRNLWRQSGVMTRGSWMAQHEIDSRLEAIAAALRPGADFVPLFDGATLAGWVVEETDAGNFYVRDGALRAEGPAGWLRSERQYSDFVLRAEFRFLTDDSDSGIFLRADGVTPFIRGWPGNSYQVQLRDISTNRSENPIWLGNVYRHRVAEGGETSYDAAAALAAARPTGEWQEIEIEAIGGRLTVRLNGTSITRAENLVNPSGYIGIQGETGIVEYRRIEIREE